MIDDALHLVSDGADLYVERVGPPTATPVIFLHGGPGSSAHVFRELIGEDLEAFHMVYADQRGGGRSYADQPFALDTLADDVAAIARALELPGVVLLAHGFGAAVAARTVARHPELVRGQVWLNPWLSMPMLARTLQRQAAAMGGRDDEALPPEAALAEGAHDLDPDALVDDAFRAVGAKPLLDALLFADDATRLRLEHAESTVLLGPSESAGLLDPWHVDVLPDLGMRAVPTAVLVATDDRSSYPDQAEAALARLPHAVTALLAGGHHCYASEPVALLEVLLPALAHASGET